MSGQSVKDRITAAKYSIAGQGLAKSVCKATTEEVIGPKKKHLDYLIQCTNEPNVSIPQLANLLIERTQTGNWVIVFKALVSVHNIMNYGNERFSQYLASNNCTFASSNFSDKAGGVQGYDMSTYIRRYAKYINEKAASYRLMAFDFCKVKRGKEDGMLRTMAVDKLLKTLPVLQAQLDALLEFDASPSELTNGVINAAFVLLFKDLIRLFACYNDGIINLLEKYFDMNKKQCKDALDVYKKFIARSERVAEYLKVCEKLASGPNWDMTVGIDKGDIPDLAKAPSSLLEALEDHLKSLEGVRKSSGPVPSAAAKPAGMTSAISSFSAAAALGGGNDYSPSVGGLSEQEKRRIIEEENAQLQQLKEKRERELGTQKNSKPAQAASAAAASSNNPFASAVAPQQSSALPKQQSVDLFGLSSPTSPPATQQPQKSSDDLFGFGASAASPFGSDFSSPPSNNAFVTTQQPNAFGMSQNNAFGASNAFGVSQLNNGFGAPQSMNAFGAPQVAVAPQQSFNPWGAPPAAQSAFSSQPQPSQGFEAFGEVMKPHQLNPIQQPQQQRSQQQKLISGDLDASLASLAGSLTVNNGPPGVSKQGVQWGAGPADKNKKTGGTNFQTPVAPATMMPMNPQPLQVGQPRPAGGAWPASGAFGQQPPAQQPNDPFGAL